MKISLALLAIMAVLVISTAAADTTKGPSKGAAKQTEKPKVTEKSMGSDKPKLPGSTSKQPSQNGKRSTLSKGQTKSRPTGTGTRQTPKRAKAFY